MQSLSRGWSFLQQAWSMAFKDKDLLKPSVYALIAGMVVSVIGIIPIIAVYFIFSGQLAEIILFIVVSILAFVQFGVSYVFSGMTAYLIYGFLSEGDGRMDKAWEIVRRDFLDIMMLAGASTVVNMLKRLANRNNKNNLTSFIISSAAGMLEVLWTEASFLILPAMVIDDLSLKDGVQRVAKIAKENLLLIGVSTVGVRFVTGVISFILTVIGIVVGLAIVFGTVSVANGSTDLTIAGIVLAALVFFPFVIISHIFSTYTNTAYHTCLYIWARDVEKARAQGMPERVAAPAPLAAVLGYS